MLWSFSLVIFCIAQFALRVSTAGYSFPKPAQNGALPKGMTIEAIEDAFAWANEAVKDEEKNYIYGKRIEREYLDEDIPGLRHDNIIMMCGPKARYMEHIQHRYEIASKFLIQSFQLSKDEIRIGMPRVELRRRLSEECESVPFPECDPFSPYRNIDGSCNNLRNPKWGMAPSCYLRLVESDYADGLSEKRRSKSGRPLPAPRTVSLQLHGDLERPSDKVTAMVMMWGQFLGHDLTLTPVTRAPNGDALKCCPVREDANPQCDPIIIPKDDPFFSKQGITCLHNVRSAACATCTLGPREQTNEQTTFIDMSQLYGPNANISRNLRNLDGTGTLQFRQTEKGGELLPPSSNPENDFCSFQQERLDCFKSGDPRINSHPALTAIHTLFHREHNRIARALIRINPHWDEEKLFQEARRIVGAQVQMITYNEFVPLLIGPDHMVEYDLYVNQSGGRTTYEPHIHPGIYIEFNSAAFRVGHSMIPGFFSLFKEGKAKGFWLKDHFFFPFGLHNGMLDELIAGLFRSIPEHVDRHVVSDVTNHLYQTRGSNQGLDLAAINVNRGRDHGVPSYTTLLKFCTGKEVEEWEDLEELFEDGLVPMFRRVYENVHDIDLFSGGLAEKHLRGALVGETFSCLLSTQFRTLKFGDRFYFEHRKQAGSFTKGQLREIRASRLSHIICRNTKVDEIQPLVMWYIHKDNPLLSCEDYPEIDLLMWREDILQK